MWWQVRKSKTHTQQSWAECSRFKSRKQISQRKPQTLSQMQLTNSWRMGWVLQVLSPKRVGHKSRQSPRHMWGRMAEFKLVLVCTRERANSNVNMSSTQSARFGTEESALKIMLTCFTLQCIAHWAKLTNSNASQCRYPPYPQACLASLSLSASRCSTKPSSNSSWIRSSQRLNWILN